MRPAPPKQPPSEGESSLPTDPSTVVDGQADHAPEMVVTRRASVATARAHRRRLVLQIAAGVVALALIGWAIATMVGGSTTAPQGSGAPSPGVSPTVPGRALFFFKIDDKPAAATGKRVPAAADNAAVEIAGRLSAFYDTVFMDPATWSVGVPDKAWKIFDPAILDRAQRDADAFTLGDPPPDLAALAVDESALVVKILLDPNGRADAAVAEVTFVASGELKDGTGVEVTNHASLLLRVEGGLWFVFGYPNATTKVESAAAAATPSTGTPSGSASP